MNWHEALAQRVELLGRSEVMAIMKLAERSDIISFAGGLPHADTFLIDEFRATTLEVLDGAGRDALGYSPTHGITPLRAHLAEQMTALGRPTEITETLVTTGGVAAMDLLAKAFIDPGDIVVVGEPSYLAALHVFRSYQARFVGVPLDQDGLRTEILEDRLRDLHNRSLRPKFIYTVPSFQNPTGTTLSEERRRHLVFLARKYEVPVIEDATYRDLRFEGQAPPLLVTLDPGVVIYLNTFSKIFCPGIRLGWLVGPSEVLDALALCKQGQDQCSSSLGQHLALTSLANGAIRRQVAASVTFYRNRRDTMLQALERFMPDGTAWSRPDGGFYIWVTLGADMDTERLLPEATRAGKVAYVPGPAFYHDGSGRRHLRLSYSFVDNDQIAQGIERLGRIVDRRHNSLVASG